jgi:hypothetical protein
MLIYVLNVVEIIFCLNNLAYYIALMDIFNLIMYVFNAILIAYNAFLVILVYK